LVKACKSDAHGLAPFLANPSQTQPFAAFLSHRKTLNQTQNQKQNPNHAQKKPKRLTNLGANLPTCL
jgi:hypothetical protein